ncbi:hypothetical protein [Helicovermis profundi]|uniref:Uncharacterized protein n=1 Tax=Helicovermis profundi TaxID=3065157 RepID=A0AAU9E608_9FIRM|nr:hypothetical protein HLPR_18510 [Clostridia bacterium S502]
MKKKKKIAKQNKESKSPKTLFQLFKLILISFIKGIPKLFKRTIIKLSVIFLIIIIINTYLLVVKNEGFSPTQGNKWLDITSLQGNVAWATAFWTFAMFFITTVLSRIKEDGLKKFLTDIFSSPSFIRKNMKSNKTSALPTLLITTTGVLLFTLLIKNKGALLLYTFIAFLSFTKRGNSFLIIFFALLKSDLNRIFHKNNKTNQSSLYIMAFSVSLAFLIAFFIRKPMFIILLSLALIGISFYHKSKHKSVKTMIFIFAFFGVNYLYYKLSGNVFADDGGWQESGATLGGWIGSDGAGTALTMGISPAAGGVLGTILGTIYSGINPNNFLPDKSVFEGILSAEDMEFVDDFLDGSTNDLADILNPLGNDETNIASSTNVADGMSLDDQVDYTNILGNFLGLDSTGNSLKNGLRSLFENTDSFSDYMKDMVKNSKIYDYVSETLQGDQKSKLNWLKKSFESMKDSKVNKYLSILEGGLTFVGSAFDSYDNFDHGDDLSVAISKSMATNATVFLAGKTSGGPSLALWEMGNHMLFGGSKAADIGSPTKLIKGGMNWALDFSGGMDPKTIATRMDSGYYGENIKNLYYGSDMVKDFVKDPGSFYDEVSSFTRAGSENWDNMNKTVDDIFKLPKNVNESTKDLYSTKALQTAWHHPLDTTRKLATDAAHLATKTAVKVGEGWAYIGDAAGTASVSIENSVTNSYNYLRSFFH